MVATPVNQHAVQIKCVHGRLVFRRSNAMSDERRHFSARFCDLFWDLLGASNSRRQLSMTRQTILEAVMTACVVVMVFSDC